MSAEPFCVRHALDDSFINCACLFISLHPYRYLFTQTIYYLFICGKHMSLYANIYYINKDNFIINFIKRVM